jgi:hypothetical protein
MQQDKQKAKVLTKEEVKKLKEKTNLEKTKEKIITK